MCILLAVAFLTLLERNVMGIIHNRIGPNKVLYMGLLQPIIDGLKLFFNSHIVSVKLFPSVLSLIVQLLLLCVLDLNLSYILLLYLGVLSISVWPLILASWSSYSSYPVIATLRIVAQSISYEVVLYLLLVPLSVMSLSWSGYSVYPSTIYVVPLSLLGIIIALSEIHRTPFDFAEGESELVSGYNTEFSSLSFTLLFLSEYLAMLVMCILLSLIIYGVWYTCAAFISALLTVRFVYVRMRYDHLMVFLWKYILPIALVLLLLIFMQISSL